MTHVSQRSEGEFLLTVQGGMGRVRTGSEFHILVPEPWAEDPLLSQFNAEVAELVDALASGVSEH